MNEVQIAIPVVSPAELRKNGHIDPQKRRQPKLGTLDAFPKRNDRICACGCEKPLLGRKRRWATENCSDSVRRAMNILHSDTEAIGWILGQLHGRICAACDGHGPFEVDHIIEVRDGGGGLWLDNYQLLCHDCHVAKTTFSRRKRKALAIANGQHEMPL